jgi:hypothetical protein
MAIDDVGVRGLMRTKRWQTSDSLLMMITSLLVILPVAAEKLALHQQQLPSMTPPSRHPRGKKMIRDRQQA